MNNELINQANKYIESEIDVPESAKMLIRILCSALQSKEIELSSAKRTCEQQKYPRDLGNY